MFLQRHQKSSLPQEGQLIFNPAFLRSPKNDFHIAQNVLNNDTQSELSAWGGKRDVEKTPKCTRLNCILAPGSHPLRLASHGRLWPSIYKCLHKCCNLWKYFTKYMTKYLHISFQNEHPEIFCFWSTLICKNVFLFSVFKIFILTETLMELLFCSWMIETLFKRKWYILTHISFPGARFGWIWILGVRIQSWLSGTTLHLETFLLSS